MSDGEQASASSSSGCSVSMIFRNCHLNPVLAFRCRYWRRMCITFCIKMKYLIPAVASIFCASILGSCDGSDHASESSKSPEVIGNKRCDVHQKDCLEEDTSIVVSNGPSYPEGYWEARRSEEYIQAVKQMFPNANSTWIYAVPGTDYAKREGGKKFRRFYCSECREQEEKWWHSRTK